MEITIKRCLCCGHGKLFAQPLLTPLFKQWVHTLQRGHFFQLGALLDPKCIYVVIKLFLKSTDNCFGAYYCIIII